MNAKRIFDSLMVDTITKKRIAQRAEHDGRSMSGYLRELMRRIPKDRPYAIG